MERPTLSNHPPASCTRGPEGSRPTLHLAPSPKAQSMLELTLASGVTCEAFLPPRYTRLLLACAEAWQEDEGTSETFRGFRSNQVIAARLSELSPFEGNAPLDPKMVRVYVYELRDEISKAVSSLASKGRTAAEAPALIENLRAYGYRIAACGLDIVPPGPVSKRFRPRPAGVPRTSPRASCTSGPCR